MKKVLLLLVIIFSVIEGFAQVVGISESTFTPNTQAILDLTSDRRGFLPPRMELNGNDLPIAGTKPAGLMVYNSSGAIGPDGLYYWTGSAWVQITTTANTIGGSGTLNYVPKFTPNGTTIGNSSIFDNGNVGVNTTSPVTKLTVRAGSNSTTLADYANDISDKHGLVLNSNFSDGTYSPGLFWNTTNDNPTKPKAGIMLQMTNAGSNMLFGTSTTYATGLTNLAMGINDMGNVGVGVVPTLANFSVGNWNSGLGGTPVNGDAQVLISGAHNSGINNGLSGGDVYKLKIEGYDNDNSYPIYPIYAMDENSQVDFWLRNRFGASSYPLMFLDGRMGIGTTDPNHPLVVAGSDATNPVVMKVQNLAGSTSGGSKIILGNSNAVANDHSSAQLHAIRTNAGGSGSTDLAISTSLGTTVSEKVRITANGNVGIGTSTPVYRLEIVDGSPGPDAPLMRLGLTNGDVPIVFEQTSESSAWTIGQADGTAPNAQEAFVFSRGTSLQTDPKLVVLPSGNVGIGTPNPSQNLHVWSNGDAGLWLEGDADNSTESDNVYIKMTQDGQLVNSIIGMNGGSNIDGEGNAYSGGINNALLIGTTTAHDLQLGTNATAHLTMDASGNIGVGTSSPAAQLDVQGGRMMKQGNLTTYVRTISAGASATAFSIARQFHDQVNWGSGGMLVEVFTHYHSHSSFDYGMHMAKYGYSSNSASVDTKISGGAVPYWGGVGTISGNIKYRDLYITVPAYFQITVRITTGITVTDNVNSPTQNRVYFY